MCCSLLNSGTTKLTMGALDTRIWHSLTHANGLEIIALDASIAKHSFKSRRLRIGVVIDLIRLWLPAYFHKATIQFCNRVIPA